MADLKDSIPYVNLGQQWQDERAELLPLIDQILSAGQYIGGDTISSLEESIALYCDRKYCLALNSGTDALLFGMASLGIGRGDEVITPPNSFIASTAVIAHLGATPVFVDVLPDQNIDPSKIEAAITSRTKAIMPVHLTGRMCQMDIIMSIAKKNNLLVIEDAAQAIGSKYKGHPSGKWGNVGCFSAHPLKNLNACGDGGFLVTDDKDIYDSIGSLRNHGLIDRNTAIRFGYVSRMDAVQGVIIKYRLKHLNEVIQKRRTNAKIYKDLLNSKFVTMPQDLEDEYNTYHTFVVQVDQRDDLKKYLEISGVETSIHYPVPIHLQPAAKYLGYREGSFPVAESQSKRILTLPVNQYLLREQINKICKLVNSYYG